LALAFRPEDEGSMFLRNVDFELQVHMALLSRPTSTTRSDNVVSNVSIVTLKAFFTLPLDLIEHMKFFQWHYESDGLPLSYNNLKFAGAPTTINAHPVSPSDVSYIHTTVGKVRPCWVVLKNNQLLES
jgi:hypothetical protein